MKELDGEIEHFRHIKVSIEYIYRLEQKIGEVKEYPVLLEKLRQQYQQLSFDEIQSQMEKLNQAVTFEHDNQRIQIEYIAQHYYIPTIYSLDYRADFIKHIIKVESEVKFVNDLNRYAQQKNNHFQKFDWWLFSKLDEHLDHVYLPYYDAASNQIRKFNPDFIFWLKKGNDYYIVFIDPKGTKHTDYEHKIDGYIHLFEDNNVAKPLHHNGLAVKVFSFLRTKDRNTLSEKYKEYWFDEMEFVLKKILR